MAVGPDGKIVKATNSKKVTLKKEKLSVNDIERQIELEQTNNDSAATESRSSKNKLTGIVIDGKTYTCATCKSGHRVGVCKHAYDRPMKPTHAPGRPAAGAPKKVVCDCPKKCSCIKDCKCPRDCLCTQTMYMLVYIPGPGEEKWEIDREVITDLKGNILAQDEIEARRKQKEALKEDGTSPGSIRSRSSSTVKFPTSPSEAKPKASGGCCAHKQAVAKERQQAIHLEAANVNISLAPNASTHGCNCGAACSCAFCPQHPNNQVSRNVARQQALWISQQQVPMNANFMQFHPNMPQEVSCMGGQPRFAVSRHPIHPTISNFEEAFPSTRGSGYILAYPMRGRVTPSPQPPSLPNISTLPSSFPQLSSGTPATNNTSPEVNLQWDLMNEYFDIDDAMVANDGPNGWEQYFMHPNESWGMPGFSAETSLDNLDTSTNAHDIPISRFDESSSMHMSNDFPLSPTTTAPTSTTMEAASFLAIQPHNQRRHTVIPTPMATGGSVCISPTAPSPGIDFNHFSEDGFFDPRQLIPHHQTQTRQNFTNAL